MLIHYLTLWPKVLQYCVMSSQHQFFRTLGNVMCVVTLYIYVWCKRCTVHIRGLSANWRRTSGRLSHRALFVEWIETGKILPRLKVGYFMEENQSFQTERGRNASIPSRHSRIEDLRPDFWRRLGTTWDDSLGKTWEREISLGPGFLLLRFEISLHPSLGWKVRSATMSANEWMNVILFRPMHRSRDSSIHQSTQ